LKASGKSWRFALYSGWKDSREIMASAWVGVVTHKLRSFLTILGIVIGVAAVIALMSIGKGAQSDILGRIESMGANRVSIYPGSTSFGGVRTAQGSAITLTVEDGLAIAQNVKGVDAVIPTISRSLQIVSLDKNTNSQVVGTAPRYLEAYNLKIGTGSFFTGYDYDNGSRVVVLGSEIAKTLFPDKDPIGQTVRVGGNIFFVVGVTESKGNMPGSPDNMVIIPLSAMQQVVSQPRTPQGDRIVSTIDLTVINKDETDRVIADVSTLLRQRHRLSSTTDDDFNIRSMQDMVETLTAATDIMTTLLGAIAAISLLVGGIGVMNIMLVSVLERTREIGIRKALGAGQRTIWMQFLIEAAFLSLAGGIIGIILGWLIAFFVGQSGVIKTMVTPETVLLAFFVSVLIGVFFGFYPAWNASRLNPIQALRSE
jgi:putative ABC transport system permease protein